MSVASHLAIDLAEYDRRIRTFIPDYETMLDVAAASVPLAARRVRRVVDLGTGTGALALRVSRAVPGVVIHGIDLDDGMLEVARRRLRRQKATLVCGSFLTAPLPSCDAATASFALHHVASSRLKGAFYRRLFRALRPGGLLVSADCQPADARRLAAEGRRAWLDHLAATYGRRGAERFLRAWSEEDFYVPLGREMALVAGAGFAPEVVWRHGAFAVIAAWRR